MYRRLSRAWYPSMSSRSSIVIWNVLEIRSHSSRMACVRGSSASSVISRGGMRICRTDGDRLGSSGMVSKS